MTPASPDGDLFNVKLCKRLLVKLQDELKKIEAMCGREWEHQRIEGQSQHPEDSTIFAGMLGGIPHSTLMTAFPQSVTT